MNKNYKFSALFAALTLVASTASAATIYDKDGTTLGVNGYIQSWAGNQLGTAKDNSLTDRVRFGLEGSSKLNDSITAFSYYQWQVQHSSDSTETADVYARYAYLGLDFGKYGKLLAGRYFNNLYNIEAVTDVYEINAGYGEISGQRNSGKLVYSFDYKGFGADVEFQLAEDNYWLGYQGNLNVENGYSVVLHYDSAPVLFGPIGVKLGYSYLNFQDENATRAVTDFDDYQALAGSLTWGTHGKGLYLGGFYEYAKFNVRDQFSDYQDVKEKAAEAVIAYGFDSGVIVQAGYQWHEGNNISKDKDGNYTVQSAHKTKTAKVPLLIEWRINPQFRVWAESTIDAGSSDEVSDHTLYTVGARYTF